MCCERSERRLLGGEYTTAGADYLDFFPGRGGVPMYVFGWTSPAFAGPSAGGIGRFIGCFFEKVGFVAGGFMGPEFP